MAADGTLWAWGVDNFGQLGFGGGSVTHTTPTRVGSASDWVKVACSGSSSWALNEAGEVWHIGGEQNRGERGDGSYSSTPSTSPRLLPGTWANIAGGAAAQRLFLFS